MTADDLPAAAPPGAGAMPELRASHEDRDRVAEMLRIAAADGRLTVAELDERLGVALTARTIGELTALAADLSEAAGLLEGSRRGLKTSSGSTTRVGMPPGAAGGWSRSGWRYVPSAGL
jgi:hypothetical protein